MIPKQLPPVTSRKWIRRRHDGFGLHLGPGGILLRVGVVLLLLLLRLLQEVAIPPRRQALFAGRPALVALFVSCSNPVGQGGKRRATGQLLCLSLFPSTHGVGISVEPPETEMQESFNSLFLFQSSTKYSGNKKAQ